MLTAVSVARGCGMVAPDDQTIVMKAELLTSSPDPDQNTVNPTTIRYSLLGVSGGRAWWQR